MATKKKSNEKALSSSQEKEKGKKDIFATLASTQTRETLSVIFAVRAINAYLLRTFFQPDEYFQALEPAWQLVFGDDSGAWLTWEWKHQLRSSLHPALIAFGYWVVDSFWGSTLIPTVKAQWLLLAPKAIQTALAALSDWYTWRLAEKIYGQSSLSAWSVLAMALLNPWQWYTSTRTFSNCFETTLTAMALYYWPWELLGMDDDKKSESKYSSRVLFQTWGEVNSLRSSLVLAALAVLLRPTNALIWLALGTLTLTRFTLSGKSPLYRSTLLVLFREIFLCGSFVLGLSLYADRQYFGDWTFPPFTWLHFNVAQDLAVFYGQNDWHYYLSQGIPLLCTTVTPFALKGLYKSMDAEASGWPTKTANAQKALSFAIITTIAALSLVSHKEVRFITPLLPALHLLAAPHLVSFFTTATPAAGASCPTPTSPSPIGWKRKPLLAAGLLINLVIGGYLSLFHAVAPIKVMDYLRHEFETLHPEALQVPLPADFFAGADHEALSQELFALFLTPCHATPWRSHLVYPALRARALTCDPPLGTLPESAERAAYADETRRFYGDPVAYLRDELWPADAPGEDMARYVVGFEGADHAVETALRAYFDWSGPGRRHKVQLREVWRGPWNGLFADDDRKAGSLVVWATGFYDNQDMMEDPDSWR
ncbi:glycosyltransferase family 22 protein [Xylariomycetidae sp. FL2044]|nr:glycosyltransferase family 22 protein [Xylariomycetidae sp. FL2044]